MNKRIKKIFLLFLIIYALCILCSSKSYARTIDTNIDGIDDSQYPGFKAMIKELQANNPNWTFKVEYTDLTWEEVLTGEHQGHGGDPSNLVDADSRSYAGLWICEICGKQRYDNGGLYCASVEALEYMMDPRNSLNESDLFQFMQLSSFENCNNETVRATLRSMASSYPLIDEECIDAVIDAANNYCVDPYYIMAKILEEQSITSPLYTGSGLTDSNGNVLYEGYYNLLNVGAYASTGRAYDVILNGLAYAARPSNNWTSKGASIDGGVALLANSYISKDQDTLYYQKFDVVGDSSKYEHQYQQHVLGAQTAGTLLRRLYRKFDSNLEGNYSFIIPLYKNMPVDACPRPATDQEHSQGSGVTMGDVNQDGKINIIDVIKLVNYLNGNLELNGAEAAAAKVCGHSNITILDAIKLINYLNDNAVLPSGDMITTELNYSTNVRLTPSGTGYRTLSGGTSIKILGLGSNVVNGEYWDLIVSANGVYGYIPRSSYQ